jgi:hypothetical protein
MLGTHWEKSIAVCHVDVFSQEVPLPLVVLVVEVYGYVSFVSWLVRVVHLISERFSVDSGIVHGFHN